MYKEVKIRHYFLIISTLAVLFISCAPKNDNTYLGLTVSEMRSAASFAFDMSVKENMLKSINCIVLAEYVSSEAVSKKFGIMDMTYKVIDKLYGEAEEAIHVFGYEEHAIGEQAILLLQRHYMATDKYPTYAQVPQVSLVLKELNTDGPFNVKGQTDYNWFRVSQIKSDIETYKDIIGSKLTLADAIKVSSVKEAEKLADYVLLVKVKYITGRGGSVGGVAKAELIDKLKGPEMTELVKESFTNIPVPVEVQKNEDYYILLKRNPAYEDSDVYEPFARGYTAIPYDSSDGEYIRSLYGETKLD